MERARALLEALRDHDPADDDERGHLSLALDLLASPGDPFDRGRFDPGHVTSSGYVLSPDGDGLLLIRHAVLDRWLQPGGHVERGDRDLVEAARREVREETGLADLALATPRPFDVDVHPIPARPGQPAHLHFDVRWLFRARSGTPRSGSDAVRAAWVPLARVGDLHHGASSARVLAKIAESGPR